MSDKLRPSVKLYVKEKPRYEGFSGKFWSFDPFDTFDTKLQNESIFTNKFEWVEHMQW